MHFDTKSYLKNTRNHTAKHALSLYLKKQFDAFKRTTQNVIVTWNSSP